MDMLDNYNKWNKYFFDAIINIIIQW
jgi:hypothetical protein